MQEDVTPYDFDTLESTNREQATVVEDEKDCMPDGLTVNQSEIMLCKRHKHVNLNSIISHLRIKPEAKAWLKIPLYRL